MKSKRKLIALATVIILAGCGPEGQKPAEPPADKSAATNQSLQPRLDAVAPPVQPLTLPPPALETPPAPAPQKPDQPPVVVPTPTNPPPEPETNAAFLFQPTPSPTVALFAVSTPGEPWPSEKDQFVGSTDQKIKDFEAKMAELVERAESYTGDAKVQADQALATLRAECSKARAKLEALRQVSAAAWKELKSVSRPRWTTWRSHTKTPGQNSPAEFGG